MSGTRRAALLLLASVLLLAGCGRGGGGRDMAGLLGGLPGFTQTPLSSIPDVGSGADGAWTTSAAPLAAASAIGAKAKPRRTQFGSSAGDERFLLFPGGTVWLKAAAGGGTNAILYRNNRSAIARHGFLGSSRSWSEGVDSLSGSRSGSGSGSSGNGFRGGGSGSGK